MYYLRFLCIACWGYIYIPAYAQSVDTTVVREYINEVKNLTDSTAYELAITKGEEGLGLFGEPELLEELELRGDLLFEISVAHRWLKQNREALELADSSLQVFREAIGGRSVKVARAYSEIGANLQVMGKFEAAIDTFTKVIELLTEMEEGQKTLADCYMGLGGCYNRIGRVEEGGFYLRKALELGEKVYSQRELGLARIYNALGAFSHNLSSNENDSVAYYFRKALAIAENANGPMHPYTGTLISNLGIYYITQGENDSAIVYHQRALESRSNPEDVATSLSFIGLAYQGKNNFYQAEKYIKEALRIWYDLYPEGKYVMTVALENLYGIYSGKGDYVNANHVAQQLLDIRKRTYIENHPLIASSHLYLAYSYGLMNNEMKEEEHLNQAVSMLDQLENAEYQDFIRLYSDIATIKENQEKWDEAEEMRKMALEYAIKRFGGDHGILVWHYNNLATNRLSAGEYKTADVYMELAERFFNIRIEERNSQPLKNRFTLNWNKARYYLGNNDFDQSRIYLSKGMDLLGAYPDSLLYRFPMELLDLIHEYGLTYTSEYEQQEDLTLLKKAREYFQLEITTIDKAKRSQIEADSKTLFVESLLGRYETAIDNDFKLFEVLGANEYKHSIFNYIEKTKSTLLLEEANKWEIAENQFIPDSLIDKLFSLQVEKNNFRNLIGQAELDGSPQEDIQTYQNGLFEINRKMEQLYQQLQEDYPDYYRLKYDYSVIGLNELQSKLDPDQGVLEYFLGEEHVYSFLITRDSSYVNRAAVDFPLEEWVDTLRNSIYSYWIKYDRKLSEYKSDKQDFMRVSYQLYDKLIGPMDDKLPAKLAIIPDGVLGYVPFDALLTAIPEAGANANTFPYLLKKHQISYAYSATLLAEMQQKRNNPQYRLIAFAPEFEEETMADNQLASIREGLGSLQYNVPEVQSIQGLIGGELYVREQAIKTNFLSKTEDYQIVHLSTHAKADDRLGNLSFLAFTEIPDSIENEFVYVNDLYNLRLNADLVVLSACETGLGELQRGEGILSIARAFAYAGAKSIVSSLWSVDDESTKFLMERFYHHLSQEKPKDEALRLAKLDYLESDYPSDPFFWAAFIPVGDMSPIQLVNARLIQMGGILLGIMLLIVVGILVVRNRKG